MKSLDGAGRSGTGAGARSTRRRAETVRRGVPGVRRRREPARDRAAAERGRRPRPLGQALDGFDHPRPREARHRPDQQRVLHRPAGVEPAALRQEPGDGESGCRGSTRRRTGSSRRSPSSASSTMRCGRRSRTARARSRSDTRPLTYSQSLASFTSNCTEDRRSARCSRLSTLLAGTGVLFFGFPC